MKRLLAILAVLMTLPIVCRAQAVRYAGNAYTINTSSPQPGGLYPVLASTSATVQICTYSTSQTCPSLATTYTDAAEDATCPTTAQLTPSNSGACTAAVDSTGNFGAWLAGGNYQYMVKTSYGTFGPYDFSVGGSGGSSGVTFTCTAPIVCTPSGATNAIAITYAAVTPFTINSFTGPSGTVEVGTSFTNPSFSASYSVTPTSANITNTASIDSPHVLGTPFTSATLSGTYTLPAVSSSITWTLTAIQSSTQTASLTVTGQESILDGTGSSGGATGATASGTSAVLVGDTGTLPSFQLGPEVVGSTTFVFTGLTGQYVYMLLVGGSHTFTDQIRGFPFAVNSPTQITFTNANGVALSMYLYQSVNALTGNFSPKVTS